MIYACLFSNIPYFPSKNVSIIARFFYIVAKFISSIFPLTATEEIIALDVHKETLIQLCLQHTGTHLRPTNILSKNLSAGHRMKYQFISCLPLPIKNEHISKSSAHLGPTYWHTFRKQPLRPEKTSVKTVQDYRFNANILQVM